LLNSTEHWTALDGNFNLEVFYNLIVDLFEQDPNDPWVVDTLEFWNKCIYQVFISFYLHAYTGKY
jgi:hypothetical protein